MKENCTHGISSRKKQHGFAIPLANMIRTSLKEKVTDTLTSNNNISEFIDKKYVSNIIQKALQKELISENRLILALLYFRKNPRKLQIVIFFYKLLSSYFYLKNICLI